MTFPQLDNLTVSKKHLASIEPDDALTDVDKSACHSYLPKKV